MERTVNAAVSITPLLKREECKRTEHDSAFSQWKILVGPCDWNDYLLNKEGAERYRTHNLPNCSSCSGLYELAIVVSFPRSEGKSSSKLNSKCVIPVYLGQADNVRTRLQQYGRDGAHLENVPRLFSDTFANGHGIAFRWAPMESKKKAEKTESQLLKTFNYAWNRGMNGERRPSDIHQKLGLATSSTKRLPLDLKRLCIIHPKKVGLSIKRCDSPMLENGSSFYTKQEGSNILSKIIKFSRSRPTLVSRECEINNSEARTCGVALGQGSICTRPPVEGRKRCADHKGMKINGFVIPHLLSNTDYIPSLTSGVTLDEASLRTRMPVAGGKQCEEHKGMRINGRIPLVFVDRDYRSNIGDASLTCGAVTLDGSFCGRKPGEDSKFCWQHEATRAKITYSSRVSEDYRSNIGDASLTCGATTLNGSCCRRKPGDGSKFCWQHEATRAKITHSYRVPDLYETSPYSSTCGAITKRGTRCSRRTTGGRRCFQH